jgi:glucose-1-phosphate adenylyltransferase
MDLLSPTPPLDLDDPDLRVRTSGAVIPPAWIGPRATIHNALISPGARINGAVFRSILSPGVVVEEGAEIRDSVIHHRCVIREGAVIDRAILDKEVTVGRGCVVGEGDDNVPNFERPDIVNSGISIVSKRVVIPSGLRIGRNVVIGPGVHAELVDRGDLESGASIHPTQMPLHLFV